MLLNGDTPPKCPVNYLRDVEWLCNPVKTFKNMMRLLVEIRKKQLFFSLCLTYTMNLMPTSDLVIDGIYFRCYERDVKFVLFSPADLYVSFTKLVKEQNLDPSSNVPCGDLFYL